MNKNTFLVKLKESFLILKSNYKLLWLGIFAELLFLFLFGFFTGPIRNGLGNNLLALGDLIVGESSQISNGLSSNIINSEPFRNIIILGIVLALIVYVLYCLFHGFIWRFSFNLYGKKRKYLPYIKRFFLVNILWYILFIVYVLINFIFSYADIVGKRFEPEGFFFLSGLSNMILLGIIYFAFISYVFIEENKAWVSVKDSFKAGFKRFLKIIPYYLAIGIIFLSVNYLLVLTGNISYVLLVFLGILIVMPLMIWSRILIKSAVDEL